MRNGYKTVAGGGRFWPETPPPPCLRGVQRHILGLQCHSSGCNFRMEWSVWINGTQTTYPMATIGDGGHVRCTMGPKRSLESVFTSLKTPCLRGFSCTFLSSNLTQVAVISGWNELYGSMGPVRHDRNLAFVMGGMPSAQWVPNGE